MLLASGVLVAAVAIWSYRAPILEWAIENRFEAAGAPASLSVAAFDIDRLAIRDISIGAPAGATIRSLELRYDLDGLLRGRLTSIEAAGVRLKRGEIRADVERITGSGAFALGLRGLSQLRASLDILRATLAGERIDPSHLVVAYQDASLAVETTIPSGRGFVTLLGRGSLAADAPPFRVNLSGRLDPALFPFMNRNAAHREAVSFALNASFGDLLAGIASIREGAWTLPARFSADGELGLDLGAVSIAGYSFGAPGRDRVRFRLDDIRTTGAETRGGVAVDIDIGPRKHRGVAFARASVALDADVRLSREKLKIELKPDSGLRILDLQDAAGVRLDGETAFRLAGENNHLAIDLTRRTARHRLQGQFVRNDGTLRLRSEGDLSEPEDPVVFTLQGKIDPAPVLALFPGVRAKSGACEIFLAGAATSLLPPRPPSVQPSRPASGSLRLDGAITVRLEGAAFPDVVKTDGAADRISLNLKGFEAARGWRRGRFSMSAELAARRIGRTAFDSAALALDGQLRGAEQGYRFRFEPGGAIEFGAVRTPLLALREGLRLQLTGKENTLETDRDFRPAAARLRFEHIEARGDLSGPTAERTPFRLSLPWLTGAFDKDGQEYRTKDGALILPGLAIAAQGLSLTARMTADGASAELAASDVRHRVRRPLVSPVSVSGRARLRKGVAQMRITARQNRTPLRADATITHDFNRGTGRMRFTAPRFNLADRRYRFGDMFPIALDWFDGISGAASAEGEVNWDRDLLSGHATITADQADLTMQDLRIKGMNGAVNFIELWPPVMPPRQRITGMFAFADLDPMSFRLEIQLNEDGSIAVQDLDIAVADGRLRSRGIVAVHETGLSASGKVEADSIALQDALDILGLDGLEGRGRVSGTFPITLRNSSASIADGRLSADGPGRLRYRGGALAKRLLGSPDANAATLRALSDFQFDSLHIDLEKSSGGAGTVALRLHGQNPEIYEGSAIALDMRVASDLRKLERLVLGGFQTSADISVQADGPPGRR